jgi:uncharacterized membrane protein YphA (DoxX/SURF4 family)
MDPGQNLGRYWVLESAIRILLGLVFLLYGLDKISQPDVFARSIANYRILPEVFVNLMAVVLPWVEVLCGLLLISGQWIRSAALLSGFLLAVFVIAVSITLVRGLDIRCGCFNTNAGRKVGMKLLGEDLLFLGMSFVLVLKARDRVGWRALLGLGERQH